MGTFELPDTASRIPQENQMISLSGILLAVSGTPVSYNVVKVNLSSILRGPELREKMQ